MNITLAQKAGSPFTVLRARRRVLAYCLLAVAATATPAGVACAQSASDTLRFLNPPTLSTPRGYSHVAEVPAGSRMLFIAGQVALDSAGRLVGIGDLRAQTSQVFENIRRALAAGGASFREVVKLNYYITDASQLNVVREVRDRYVNVTAPPASTLVEVRRLFRDDVLIEIEAVAVVQRRASSPSPQR